MCGDGRARVGECGMVWFWLLGLSASVLAGREAGLPHQLPGPMGVYNMLPTSCFMYSYETISPVLEYSNTCCIEIVTALFLVWSLIRKLVLTVHFYGDLTSTCVLRYHIQ